MKNRTCRPYYHAYCVEHLGVGYQKLASLSTIWKAAKRYGSQRITVFRETIARRMDGRYRVF